MRLKSAAIIAMGLGLAGASAPSFAATESFELRGTVANHLVVGVEINYQTTSSLPGCREYAFFDASWVPRRKTERRIVSDGQGAYSLELPVTDGRGTCDWVIDRVVLNVVPAGMDPFDPAALGTDAIVLFDGRWTSHDLNGVSRIVCEPKNDRLSRLACAPEDGEKQYVLAAGSYRIDIDRR